MVTLHGKRIETKIEISARGCGITVTEMVSFLCDKLGKFGDFRQENQFNISSRLGGNPSRCMSESAESFFFFNSGSSENRNNNM